MRFSMHFSKSITALLVLSLLGCIKTNWQNSETNRDASIPNKQNRLIFINKAVEPGRTHIVNDGDTGIAKSTVVRSQISIQSKLSFDVSPIVEDAERVVAIGDLHADLQASRDALRLAGAIDEQDRWIGAGLNIVQVGDLIDRGEQDREVLDFFQKLQIDAKENGGAIYLMNGNHEAMNVMLDFSYADANAWDGFIDIEYDPNDSLIQSYPVYMRGRVAAFRPGGYFARILAQQRTILITKGTLFVHGALLPEHVDYSIEQINREVSAWMLGYINEPISVIGGMGPIWLRTYSYETSQSSCEQLENVLDSLYVERMVVGHTVQYEGITSDCDEKVWRIDTGMSQYYGGTISVLEITDAGTAILKQ